MQDKSLTCRDCGGKFLFTVGEQEFFAQKGLDKEPTRCPDCRAARRAVRPPGTFRTPTAGGDHSGPDTPRASRPVSGFSGPEDQRTFFPVECARCGKSTRVPFEPRPGRPAYCASCYSAVRAGSPEERRVESQDRAPAEKLDAWEPVDARRHDRGSRTRHDRDSVKRYDRGWDDDDEGRSGGGRRSRS